MRGPAQGDRPVSISSLFVYMYPPKKNSRVADPKCFDSEKQLLLVQKLPRELFVDPYQLKNKFKHEGWFKNQ
jgi:hypothetical protein